MATQERPLAVHFGAGNIGRGFIGALLQDAGYHVVFADVNQELIDSMRALGSYTLTELASIPKQTVYSDFQVLNSVTEAQLLTQLIAKAEIVTASVGANILERIAPIIEAGLNQRILVDKLVVMACENALGASEIIKRAMKDQQLANKRAIFCNTAVDRIVPLQVEHSEPDVAVEPFSEWIIESTPLEGRKLNLPGATFVEDLDPFIERKLYTVNTAHLAVALVGQQFGHETVIEAMADSEVMPKVLAAIQETSAALIRKHGFEPAAHAAYVEKTLSRLSNPAIDDEIVRVGRDPLRKLSRYERLIGPAAYHAEHLGEPFALLEVIDAALSFKAPGDAEAARLQLFLATLSSSQFVFEVCGISVGHPLHAPLVELVDLHKSSYSPQSQLG
ncbi:MAG: mannitol-1-phosphate 5-dehydrogenase [Aquiluna sp.]|nr:mannitol-1-phosphate 5-dehydrogenase [Aquiluna sp.]